MAADLILLIGAGLVAFSAFSRRLDGTVFTAPMAFTLLGLAAALAGAGLMSETGDQHLLELFAEITLGLVLFSDAARLKLDNLGKIAALPARLLLIALPLTIALGAGVALALFGEFSIWQALLVAAILAPTDAALGASVVSNKAVPEKLRESVNVESGLNDGLALPAVLFAAALCAMGQDIPAPDRNWILFTVRQIGFGALSGLIIGAGLGGLIMLACARKWLEPEFQNLAVIGVALVAIAAPIFIGGNSFISAFVAGLAFGRASMNNPVFVHFAENEGQFFSLLIFFFFGGALLPGALEHFDWRIAAYALLSLTLVRMAPTALALLGCKLAPRDILFLGWFGPRGLASILFLFIAVESREAFNAPMVEHIVYFTVFLSVILHGVTARPAGLLFAGKEARVAA